MQANIINYGGIVTSLTAPDKNGKFSDIVLGMDDLPGYLKAFDVCLIPFADSEATRYLSPTKTLEYFAGMKPVVSSPVADVVEHYSRMVRIARAPEEYVTQVRATLTEDNRKRLVQGLEAARAHTWDSIVAQMSDLVDQALARISR